jgi:tetratricopeptide (TPR) repeat protein
MSVLSTLVQVRYAAGDIASAQRLADSLDRTATSADMQQAMRVMRASLAVIRGRITEGKRLYAESSAMQRAQGQTTKPPLVDSIAFMMQDWWSRGQRDRAASRLDAVVSALPPSALPEADRPYGDLGAAYAMLGRTDRARAVLAQIAQISDTSLRRNRQPDAHRIQAEIALAENRPRDAVAEFRRADSLPDGPTEEDPAVVLFQTGRAFDKANEPDSAITLFEQYLRTTSLGRIGSDMVVLPIIQRRLGELYEVKGDRARAVAHYGAFADLWKNADPDLQPQVADVRKRIARLSAAG